jgi:hypothetical protein
LKHNPAGAGTHKIIPMSSVHSLQKPMARGAGRKLTPAVTDASFIASRQEPRRPEVGCDAQGVRRDATGSSSKGM